MEETLISFETAKLAKEKGFDEKCRKHYDLTGKLLGFTGYDKMKGFNINSKIKLVDNGTDEFSYPDSECTATSQSLLQKWIREKPTPINVTPFTDFITWQVEIQHPDKGLSIIEKNKDGSWFDSYEEALEAGLIEALKLIP